MLLLDKPCMHTQTDIHSHHHKLKAVSYAINQSRHGRSEGRGLHIEHIDSAGACSKC